MTQIVPGRKFRRTSAQKLSDRAIIAEMHLKGVSSYRIAEELATRNSYELDPSTIRKDIATIEEQWRESALSSLDRLKATQAERLKKVMSTAWEAWEASKRPSQERTTVGVPKGEFAVQSVKEVRVTTRESAGDVSFLHVVQACINELSKLFGLNAPIGMTGEEQKPNDCVLGIDPGHAYRVLREEFIHDLRQKGIDVPPIEVLFGQEKATFQLDSQSKDGGRIV